MLINNMQTLSCSTRISSIRRQKEKSLEKVASGFKINRACDNAAGLAISESFRAQVRGLGRAEENIQEGISMMQVTDGALGDISKHMYKMRELTIMGSNDTLSDDDRKILNDEFQQLKGSIETIAESAEFNSIKLLDSDKTIVIQTRDNPYANYNIKLCELSIKSTGLEGSNVLSGKSSNDTISKIDSALSKLIDIKSNVAITMNDLSHAFEDINNSNSNITSSLSSIRDVDVAASIIGMIKDDILTKYSEAMYCASKNNIESLKKFI